MKKTAKFGLLVTVLSIFYTLGAVVQGTSAGTDGAGTTGTGVVSPGLNTAPGSTSPGTSAGTAISNPGTQQPGSVGVSPLPEASPGTGIQSGTLPGPVPS